MNLKTIDVSPQDIERPTAPSAGTLDEFWTSESLAVRNKTVEIRCPIQSWIVTTEDGKIYFITIKDVLERWVSVKEFQRALDERNQHIRRNRADG
jgi:hypothetical protein